MPLDSFLLVDKVRAAKRVYIAGNGGSYANAGHICNDLLSVGIKAYTLDPSTLTAIANDYGYDHCFEKQVEAFVKDGDVVFGLSTSGNSANIINAIISAGKKGAKTIAFTGKDGGRLKEFVDVCLMIPSSDTARIQECHITIGHILCSIIEKGLFG